MTARHLSVGWLREHVRPGCIGVWRGDLLRSGCVASGRSLLSSRLQRQRPLLAFRFPAQTLVISHYCVALQIVIDCQSVLRHMVHI